MFSRSYSNGNTCVFLKNDVEIDVKIYKIEAGKYGLSGRKIRTIYPSSLRHSVEKNVFDDDVEKVVELIVDAYRLMYAEDLKDVPVLGSLW